MASVYWHSGFNFIVKVYNGRLCRRQDDRILTAKVYVMLGKASKDMHRKESSWSLMLSVPSFDLPSSTVKWKIFTVYHIDTTVTPRWMDMVSQNSVRSFCLTPGLHHNFSIGWLAHFCCTGAGRSHKQGQGARHWIPAAFGGTK